MTSTQSSIIRYNNFGAAYCFAARALSDGFGKADSKSRTGTRLIFFCPAKKKRKMKFPTICPRLCEQVRACRGQRTKIQRRVTTMKIVRTQRQREKNFHGVASAGFRKLDKLDVEYYFNAVRLPSIGRPQIQSASWCRCAGWFIHSSFVLYDLSKGKHGYERLPHKLGRKFVQERGRWILRDEIASRFFFSLL